VAIVYYIISWASFASSIDEQAEEIYKNVKCTICSGQSIAESNTDVAKYMRDFIKKELQAGKSTTEVEKLLIEKFGDDVLFSTPFNKNSYVLWFLPILLFIIGSIICFIYIRGYYRKKRW